MVSTITAFCLMGFFYFLYVISRIDDDISPTRITIKDFELLFETIEQLGDDTSFCYFEIITDQKGKSRIPVGFQIAKVEEVMGLDWVFEVESSIEDRECFIDLVNQLGYSAVEKEMNGVEFLRVEDVLDIQSLFEDLLYSMYAVNEATVFELQYDGFTWENTNKSM